MVLHLPGALLNEGLTKADSNTQLWRYDLTAGKHLQGTCLHAQESRVSDELSQARRKESPGKLWEESSQQKKLHVGKREAGDNGCLSFDIKSLLRGLFSFIFLRQGLRSDGP